MRRGVTCRYVSQDAADKVLGLHVGLSVTWDAKIAGLHGRAPGHAPSPPLAHRMPLPPMPTRTAAAACTAMPSHSCWRTCRPPTCKPWSERMPHGAACVSTAPSARHLKWSPATVAPAPLGHSQPPGPPVAAPPLPVPRPPLMWWCWEARWASCWRLRCSCRACAWQWRSGRRWRGGRRSGTSAAVSCRCGATGGGSGAACTHTGQSHGVPGTAHA